MLIKDHHGDWGIVIGKWEGFQRAIPGRPGIPGGPGQAPVPGVPGIPGILGYLAIRFYNIRTRQWQEVQVPTPERDFYVELQHTEIDLKNNMLKVFSYLVFGRSILYFNLG